MVRLQYDLDRIRGKDESPYVPGLCRAKLEKLSPDISRAGNDVAIFEWLILSGPNRKKRIKDYVPLLSGSEGLDGFRDRLKALGARYEGDRVYGLEDVVGQQAILVLTEVPSTKKGRTAPFVGVSHVRPIRPAYHKRKR